MVGKWQLFFSKNVGNVGNVGSGSPVVRHHFDPFCFSLDFFAVGRLVLEVWVLQCVVVQVKVFGASTKLTLPKRMAVGMSLATPGLNSLK